jgi:GDPmannose 4,6-dehydratase
VTGVTGQDGSYLAELLVAEGTRVVGLARDVAAARAGLGALSPELARALADGTLELVAGDLRDAASLARAVRAAAPDEVYNLAAQSHVGGAWSDPDLTRDVVARGVERLLAALDAEAPDARFLQASSAAMYGRTGGTPCDETTPFAPEGPYAEAKLAAHEATRTARARGRFAAAAILFNHESPRRPPACVTRKVTRAAARIAAGLERTVELGALGARRDWGAAWDHVAALPLIVRADEPSDFVVATGVAHSVEELCERAFAAVGLAWRDHVTSAAALLRPAEIDVLVGDPTRARERLGWRAGTTFEELVRIMVAADVERARAEAGG